MLKYYSELEEASYPPSLNAAHAKKIKDLERHAKLTIRELLMAKVITDFKIKFHEVTGLTSSS